MPDAKITRAMPVSTGDVTRVITSRNKQTNRKRIGITMKTYKENPNSFKAHQMKPYERNNRLNLHQVNTSTITFLSLSE